MNPKATSVWGDEETMEMNLRNALMGTTAAIGAAALVVPTDARAFEVDIMGFFNFNTVVGDITEARGTDANFRSFDFNTD
jgi:hypothetical protein